MLSTDAYSGPIATIDLNAVQANYTRIKAELKSGAECAAVVKTNAYGLGLEQVAPALDVAGCRSFFVATVEEGTALRTLLPDATIYVFHGPAAGEEKDFRVASLVPVLNEPGQVERWAKANRDAGDPPMPAMLHVDTGMNRLGLSLKESEALAGKTDLLEAVHARSVMSHFACSNTPGHSLNRLQCERFARVRELFPNRRYSLANSGGVFSCSTHHFDLVRPGAALYGLNPLPERPNVMQTVVSLSAQVVQLRTLSKAESVGYGATWCAPAGTKVAIIALGYADGIVRSAGNHARVWAAGKLVPVVGTVTMDLTILDVTAIPESQLKSGDRVEVFGHGHCIDAFAIESGTIGYELLTRLGSRVKRHYLPAKASAAKHPEPA